MQSRAIFSASSFGSRPPVGLLGALMMIAFVAGVRTASIAAARIVNASSARVSAMTGLPPASLTCSGNETQYGATMTTSSPGPTSAIIVANSTPFAPGPTITSVGFSSRPKRLPYESAIARRSSRMPGLAV